jgi:hypothetical protein
MTAPEGEGAQSGAEGTQSGTGTSTGSTEGTPDPNASNGSQSGTADPNPEATRARAEAEALRARMQAADKRAADFEGKLKQLVEKDMPAQEKLTRDLQETQKQVESLQAVNSRITLENAFLKESTYAWHDPQAAMKLVDLSQVEIGEDGTAKGMKDALKALATAHPYLVKPDAGTAVTPPASTAPANNGGNGSTTPSVAKLSARFPAMNTRTKRG